MTTKDIREARERVDQAIYNFVEVLGFDPDEFDYWEINDVLDDLEETA